MRTALASIIVFTVTIFGMESQATKLDRPEVLEWAQEAASRCAPKEHPVIYSSDFGWGLNFLEAADLFAKMYVSPKRLQHRFFYDQERGFVGKFNGLTEEPIEVPVRFLYSLKKHIETALSLEYAQWVIFPDMGHTHFFIDEEEYESWRGRPNAELMVKFMNSPKTKTLYHTLEQIEVMDEDKVLDTDSWAQWRYYTRNIVGDNQGLGQLEVHKNLTGSYNTVREYKGYKYWGGGVNLSANRQGCFSYEHQGQIHYFDVSFYDLPYNASSEQY